MDEIKRQVGRAHRRLLFQQFLSVIVWSMFVCLMVGLIGVAIPKIWAVNADPAVWRWSWIGGTLAAGLIVAVVWTYLTRSQPIDAAVEIDRRYGLKERVSSSMSLQPSERETEIGHALMTDAARQVQRIDVRERFGITLNWGALLPILALFSVVGVMMLKDVAQIQAARAKESEAEITKQIVEVNSQLKKKIEEIRKEAADKDLKDAEALFKNVEKQIDDFTQNKSDADRKTAMIKLNDLKEEVEKRKQAIGDVAEMRKHLDAINDIKNGPADKAVEEMKKGNFDKALDEVKKLQEQLKNGEMNQEDMKKLAEQMQQMADKMDDAAKAHEQAKRDLEEQIKQAQRDGELSKAGQLQQKLDQLTQKDDQMNQMRQMANKMAECAQCMKPGDGQQISKQQMAQAAEALDEFAQQLGQMQNEMDELESLDDVMEQIAQAKNAMNCQECAGAGCKACQGQGGQQGDQPGFGLGEGAGQGERPEQAGDTKQYNSKIEAKAKAGEAIRTGDAGGPNIAGKSHEEIREELSNRLSEEADPLANQRLPRAQREHVEEYFKRTR